MQLHSGLVVFLCFGGFVHPQTPADLSRLLVTIFDGYNNRIRPIQNQTEPILLDISMYLFSINEVDEVDKKLVTTGYLEVRWTDGLLKWDPDLWNRTIYLTVPQDSIWKPDLVLKNGFTRFEEMGESFNYVFLANDGSVIWKPYEVFETRCSIDITYFPYDTQVCKITFIVWTYIVSEVDIASTSHGIEFYEYEENSVWSIITTDAVLKTLSSESEVSFTITLQRKPRYYIINIILPIVCLGFMGVLAFVVPADAGEKMSYSVTVFLSFAVFLTIISAQLPVNSETSSFLSLYLIFQMILGALVLVMSSVQLRLHHRKNNQNISRFFVGAVMAERCLRCRRKCHHSRKVQTCFVEKYVENEMLHESGIEWHDVTSAIDFFCFWIFLIVNTAATITLFWSFQDLS